MSRTLEVCAAALQQRFGQDVTCPEVLCGIVPVGGDPAWLWPEESELVGNAVPSRRSEFAAGRHCARRLLGRLGFPPVPLLAKSDRSPRWPRGAIGSITHDERLCAVAVARGGRLWALGLDIEPDEPLERELWPELFRPHELAMLVASSPYDRGRVARRLFSAKECVYKCTRSLTRNMLGFQDVEITLLAGGDRFRARIHHPAAAALSSFALRGFHLLCAGSILTGMSLSAATVRLALPRSTAAELPALPRRPQSGLPPASLPRHLLADSALPSPARDAVPHGGERA